MPDLVIASRNPGKIAELRTLLADVALQLLTLDDFPHVAEIDEDGETYLANATAKALAAARGCGLPALGDDSGLEVDALGGRPGVRSARYSGGGAEDNIDLLLAELHGVPAAQRTARFRCVIVVARPDGQCLSAEGTAEGRIAERRAGSGGFGYDPVVLDVTSGLSFAQMPAEQKNRISHRARACEALVPRLIEFLRA